MYPNRPAFLHPSALSPEEYPTFLSWVHDLRLPAGPFKSTDRKEATCDELSRHDIRVDDVGRLLLESISLPESHWEEILDIFYPAHRSLQPRHSVSQSHLRSLSPLSSTEVFVILRLAWHALNGRHVGSEGQSLIFKQATFSLKPSQPSMSSMVSSPSSISSSHFSVNNLSKLPPPPQHQARRTSVSTRTLPSTIEGKSNSSMTFPSAYAKPSPFIRRGSTSTSFSISDLPAVSALISLPTPPPLPPPPQRTSRIVSESSSSGAIRKTTEKMSSLSSASPLSSPSSISSKSSSSSSESSDGGHRSEFNRLRYKTPISDDGSSIENSAAEDGQEKTELLLKDLEPPQVASPNPSLTLIDDAPASDMKDALTVSSSNPFRARVHSASMLPPPEFSVGSQSLADRPKLSVVSPPLPPRPGLVNKPHSAPPLPPRESFLSFWSSSQPVSRSTTGPEPPLSSDNQIASVSSEPRSSTPRVPVKPSRLQIRPTSSIGTSTGFHTTMLIQQSLLAAEEARKKEQTDAERKRSIEVIGSSTISHGKVHRSRSRDGTSTSLGLKESERGSERAAAGANTGLNKQPASKGDHDYHYHHHHKPLARPLISSSQASTKPQHPPTLSRMSSSSSTSSLIIPVSGHKNYGRSSKASGPTVAYGTKSSKAASLRVACPEDLETNSTVPSPCLPRRSSTLASLHSLSSTSISTSSTSQHLGESLVRARSLTTTKNNDQRSPAEDMLKRTPQALENKAEEAADWLRGATERKILGTTQGTQRLIDKYETEEDGEEDGELDHDWARLR